MELIFFQTDIPHLRRKPSIITSDGDKANRWANGSGWSFLCFHPSEGGWGWVGWSIEWFWKSEITGKQSSIVKSHQSYNHISVCLRIKRSGTRGEILALLSTRNYGSEILSCSRQPNRKVIFHGRKQRTGWNCLCMCQTLGQIDNDLFSVTLQTKIAGYISYKG